MRYCRVIFILMLLLNCANTAFSSEEIEVTASVDKQTAFIGDLIEYTVTIKYDSSMVLTPPAVGLNLGQFDVKDYNAGEEEIIDGGLKQQVLWFSMRTFTTGEYIVPPLPIEYTLPDSTVRIISSDPIKIDIKSVLGEGAQADTLQLMDIRHQAALPGDNTMLYLIIIGSVIIVGGLLFIVWWKKWRKVKEEEFIDPRPSWEIAFADLAMLKNKNLPAQGEIKLFYVELTDIFRRYIGKKFEFDAIDLTTSEIYDKLKELSVESEFCDEFMAFLDNADLVKFAKYIPSEEQPDGDWQKAYELVEKSRDLSFTPPLPKQTEVYIPGYGASSDEEYDELKYAPPGMHERLSEKLPSTENQEEAK